MRGFHYVAISLTLFLAFAVQTIAQTYKSWQMDEKGEEKQKDVFALLKDNRHGNDRQGIDDFFRFYYFARWTDPNIAARVRGYANDLVTQDLKNLDAAPRDYLLNLSFDTLGKMVADRTITPTARYNAILTIGLLNQREAASNNALPVPYAVALGYLVKEYENQDNPDYIQYGALVGIYRHALLGIADAKMKDETLPQLMRKIIEDGKPTTRTPDEQELLDCSRLRALDTLGALKSVGSNHEVVDLFLRVMADEKETLEMRCYAARKLADLRFKDREAGLPLNSQKIASALFDLTKAVCDIELRNIEDARNKAKAKTGGGAISVGRGTTLSGLEDEDPDFALLSAEAKHEVTVAVRRIKSELANINWGIRGASFTGAAAIGILPELPSDDPLFRKLNDTSRAIRLLFQDLEQGPPDKPTTTGTSSGSRSPATSGTTSGPGTASTAPDPNALKVNLSNIRDMLNKFGNTLRTLEESGK